MPRRIILPKKEIYRRRADHWEWHYQQREIAKQYSPSDAARVSNIIVAKIPAPVMMIDGDVLRGIETIRGENEALRSLWMTYKSRHLMCIWYWSSESWQEFVKEFQALPDIYEDYYWVYDAEIDAARLEPISKRQKTGKKELGTSQVQVRYKSVSCT